MKTVLKTDKNYANNLKHKRIKKTTQSISLAILFAVPFAVSFFNKICKQKNTTVRDKCPPSVPQMSPKVSLNNTFYTDMTNI